MTSNPEKLRAAAMCELLCVIYQNHHFGFKIFWLNKNLFFLDSGCLTIFLKSLKFASSNQRDSKKSGYGNALA